MGVKHAFVSGVADGGDATLVRPVDWNALHTVEGFELPLDISPAQLTADTHNWAPTGYDATTQVIRASTDASRTLTGLTGGSDGRVVVIRNVGFNNLVIAHENASSTAANRFTNPGSASFTLSSGTPVFLLYDSTDSRWTLIAPTGTHSIGGTTHSGTLAHSALSGLTTGDDHTHLQKESEKGAANGYASLGADSLVPQNQLGTGVQDGTKFLRDDGTWQAVGGVDTDKAHVDLFSKGATNTVGTTAEGAGITATNLGTTFKYAGAYPVVKMDGYTTIRLMVDGLNTAAQSGTVTVEVFNVTDATSLVSLTFSSTTRNRYENNAAIALTGLKTIVARVKSSVSTDDPIFHSISVWLER